MVKYVLLKSVVPVTFDFGFRSSGYAVLDLQEVDRVVEGLGKGSLTELLNTSKKKRKK